MSKLDEIRERHKRIVQYCTWGKGSPEKQYRDDVGYLLNLLEVHPASEPPGTLRDVLAYVLGYRWVQARYSQSCGWVNGVTRESLSQVVCWRESPPMPIRYVEGARK